MYISGFGTTFITKTLYNFEGLKNGHTPHTPNLLKITSSLKLLSNKSQYLMDLTYKSFGLTGCLCCLRLPTQKWCLSPSL